MATALPPVLSVRQRDAVLHALDLSRKSHERAARASSGAVASAHLDEASFVRSASEVVRGLPVKEV